MRLIILGISLAAFSGAAQAQVAGKFPPDSLINTKVIPRETPVNQVVNQMRSMTGALGVRCQYCHVGEEGKPLAQYDFASDEKRPKLVAREMMRMVEAINDRLDSMPGRGSPPVNVVCRTCHRGVSRPVPLETVVSEAAIAAGADSALRAYRSLRERHYGRDAYDFSEPALNNAALRVARARKFDDALSLLGANEQLYPRSSDVYVVRGNIILMKGDTTAAAAAFREALRRDSTNAEARGRLRAIGARP